MMDASGDTSQEANKQAEQPQAADTQEAALKSRDEQIDALKAELKEQQNKYLYLYAELENYKKRAIRERSDLIKFGHEGFVRELLHVVDNLDRALQHTTSHTDSNDALVRGIRMVQQQLKDALAKFGVTEISSLGEKFDPQQHEAVGQEKVSGAGNGGEEGTVIREHQKGYTLHGRLLRPARVVVATK